MIFQKEHLYQYNYFKYYYNTTTSIKLLHYVLICNNTTGIIQAVNFAHYIGNYLGCVNLVTIYFRTLHLCDVIIVFQIKPSLIWTLNILLIFWFSFVLADIHTWVHIKSELLNYFFKLKTKGRRSHSQVYLEL